VDVTNRGNLRLIVEALPEVPGPRAVTAKHPMVAGLVVALDLVPTAFLEAAGARSGDPYDPLLGPEPDEVSEGAEGLDEDDPENSSAENAELGASASSRYERPPDIVFSLMGRRIAPGTGPRAVPPRGLSFQVRRGSFDLEADSVFRARLDRASLRSGVNWAEAS
jgi:hypothetical protein